MKTRRCLMILFVSVFLMEVLMAAPFSWRRPDGWVWIDEIVIGQYIRGDVNSVSNPQEYRALLYVLDDDGWQRYPFDTEDPAAYAVSIQENGDWFFSLADSPPFKATFAVLIVDPSVAEHAPGRVATLEEIPHAARDIHANVVDGDDILYAGTTKQDAANDLFYYYDPAIAAFFRELKQRPQPATASKDKALVLILGNVKQPGIHEVNRTFHVHTVLETAGGYGEQEKHALPYAMLFFKHIHGIIEADAIIYRGPYRQLPHEQQEIYLEDGDIIKVPRMM